MDRKHGVGSALLAALILGTLSDARGASLSGRSTTSLYSYQVVTRDGLTLREESDRKNWTYQRLELNLAGPGPGLSFRSDFTLRNDLSGGDLVDTRARVQYAYLEYRPAGAPLEGAIGRHYVSAGVGSGVIDGPSIRWKFGRKLELAAFAGTLGNLVRDELAVSSWEARSRMGAWGAWRPARPLALSAGCERTERDGTVRSNLVGGEMELRSGSRAGVRCELRHDLERDETIGVTAGADWRMLDSQRVWFEFQERRPQLEPDSWILAHFDLVPSRTRHLRGGWSWAFRPRATFSLRLDDVVRDSDDQRSDTVRGAFDWSRGSLALRRSEGLGGTRLGADGTLRFNPRPDLAVRLGAGMTGLEYGEGIQRERDLLAGMLEFDYRPSRAVALGTRLEYMHNDRYDQDLRLLTQLSYAFGAPGRTGGIAAGRGTR